MRPRVNCEMHSGERADVVHTLLTLDPDIGRSSNSEDQQKANEQETLEVVCRDSLLREEHSSDKLSLGCSKTSP